MAFIRKIKKGDKVYLAEVENKRINGKCVQRHIRYIGKEADGQTPLAAALAEVTIDRVKVYGPLLVLNFLAQELGLAKLLGAYGDEILSMVYAHCLDYKSLNDMQHWFARTDLNLMLNIEGLTEKRLLQALDSLERQDHESLQRTIFEAVQKQYELKVAGVIYDVTNTYLYGTKCPLGKAGHDKEGVKGRPLIQIGLGVTEEHGIPMFHKVFDGNIHDARTLRDLVEGFHHYQVQSGLVIYYDRGIPSAHNLKEIQHLRWHTLCGLPLKGQLREQVRNLRSHHKFVQLPNRVRLSKSIFYTVATPYAVGGVKGTLVVCFNEDQQRHLREARYEEILQAHRLLQQHKTIKAGLEKYFYKDGRVNQRKLTESEELDGFSCIFSTKPLSMDKIVRAYFDKDLVEKAFRTLKGITRLRPVRHWLATRVVAHVFICYLAYLLLALLQYRLRKLELSPQQALRELDSMDKVYLKHIKDGEEAARLVTLSKRQEAILRAISPQLLKV